MSLDDVLLGEMVPAMRRKLESEGSRFGFLIGLLVLLLAGCADYYLLSLLTTQTPTADLLELNLTRHLLVLLAFLNLLILPSVMKRLNLRRELKFHRQHGKWRWER